MKLVRFVFYRARVDIVNVIRRKRKLHIVDDLISGWTGLFNWWTPPYSHMSVWTAEHSDLTKDYFDIPGLYLDNGNPIRAGTCYTSTMRGKDNGTVSRPASGVFKHAGRWEWIQFEVTDNSFALAKHWADERVWFNKGYSKRDLWRFVMPLWMLRWLKLDDPDRDICSEFGEGMATRLRFPGQLTGWLLLSVLIRSPRRLWRDLVRRHHVPTYSLATGKMVRDEKGKKVKAVHAIS